MSLGGFHFQVLKYTLSKGTTVRFLYHIISFYLFSIIFNSFLMNSSSLKGERERIPDNSWHPNIAEDTVTLAYCTYFELRE